MISKANFYKIMTILHTCLRPDKTLGPISHLLVFILVIGCENESEPEIERSAEVVPVTIDTAMTITLTSLVPEDVSIIDANVVGDILELTVEYLGGCMPPEFGLVTTGGYYKTNPPSYQFTLMHDANLDSCTMNMKIIQRFDLAPIKNFYQLSNKDSTGDLIVRVHGCCTDFQENHTMLYEI